MNGTWYDDQADAEERGRYLIDSGKAAIDGHMHPLFVYMDGGDGESGVKFLLTERAPGTMPPGAVLVSKVTRVRDEPAYVLPVIRGA